MAKSMTQNDAAESEVIPDTTEAFRVRNAELVAENDKLKSEVEKLRTEKEQIQQRIPIKGFLLLPGDPFAEGTIRGYIKAKGGKTGQINFLPFTLPYSDPLARKALETYVVRADGGGDKVRADAAKKALELFPK